MLEGKIYHIVRPVRREKRDDYEPRDHAYVMTWKSLMKIGLCAGVDSDCVRKGTCEVMCAYGRRYLKEKDEHAG